MPTVLLGNTAVVVPLAGAHGTVNDEPIPVNERPELGQQITTICPPDDADVTEQTRAVVDAWRAHSSADPAWVESDDEVLEAAVAAALGCPVGCPDNGIEDVHNHDTWKEG